MKFLATPEEAARIEAFALTAMPGDASRSPAPPPTVTILFLDTPALDTARRTVAAGRAHFRIRHVEGAEHVVLERKARRGDRARLRSSELPLRGFASLAGGDGAVAPDGAWFASEVAARGLVPVCRVSYERLAFECGAGGDALRLTLDRAVRGAAERTWSVAPVAAGPDLAGGLVPFEVRFPGTLPASARALIADLGLRPRGFSKYRRCLETLGLLTPPDETHAP
jgi:hypothetical protein